MLITWRKSAHKEARRAPVDISAALIEAVARYAENRYANVDVTAMQGEDSAYRIRVRDWRLIFTIEGETLTIVKIARRGAAYRQGEPDMLTSFIITEGGEELAIMPRAAYEALIEAADEAQDLIDVRVRRDEPTISHDLAIAVIKGEMSPVEAWRKARGLTQAQLAEKTGVRPATISDIESGKSHGRFDVMQRIASALGVGLDDLAQPR